MRWLEILCLLSVLGLGMALRVTSAGWAQESGGVGVSPTAQVTGALQFRQHCAACHGPAGKGDGPVAAALTKKPANLTMLAKNNNGEFPAEKVEAFIDGGEIVAAHGTREMPIWGLEFSQPPLSFGAPQPGGPTALEVHERIKLLVDYIKSIQER